jgi:hypothetical protein
MGTFHDQLRWDRLAVFFLVTRYTFGSRRPCGGESLSSSRHPPMTTWLVRTISLLSFSTCPPPGHLLTCGRGYRATRAAGNARPPRTCAGLPSWTQAHHLPAAPPWPHSGVILPWPTRKRRRTPWLNDAHYRRQRKGKRYTRRVVARSPCLRKSKNVHSIDGAISS